MKGRYLTLPILTLILSLAVPADTLEDIYVIELKRLEESWNILDQTAEKVWQGWSDYAQVPFLFEYPNGVKLLVGHPSPPPTFSEVPGILMRDKKVHIDRTQEIDLALTPPLGGGGGPIPYGTHENRSIQVVRISSRQLKSPETTEQTDERSPEETRIAQASENQILINIHELFHVHQRSFFRYRAGNLRYNPDLNYAVYSDLEGQALEKAFLEDNDDAAREYLKDFIVARELKRESMTENFRRSESEDDFAEGTAVYSEFQTLLLLRDSYRPLLTNAIDPYFHSFRDIDTFVDKKLEGLRSSQKDTQVSRPKCYHYGCFQAVMLNRFVPGWEKQVKESQKRLDELLAAAFPLGKEEKKNVKQRLRTRYAYDTVYREHEEVINARDAVIAQWKNQQGRVYVINFKKTGEYLVPEPRGKRYTAGLIWLFPEGINELAIQDIRMSSRKTLIEQNQLYYIRWVDTVTDPDEKGYTITATREEDGHIYHNAEITTAGFTLFAPKLELRESPARVKITILAKIKEHG